MIDPGEGLGLHGFAWEAMIARAWKEQGVSPTKLPFFFRRTPSHRTARTFATAGRVEVASFRSTSADEGVVRRGWSALAKSARFRMFETLDHPFQFPDADQLSILHIMGTPEDAGSGVTFRFGATAGLGTRESLEDLKVTQTLIGATDLARAFPKMCICILQGEVGALPSERMDSDRQRAMLGRTFAAEVFAQGVPVVIVIPPLDEIRAVGALRDLAVAIKSMSGSGILPIQRAIIRAQHQIMTGYLSDPEAGWEVAMDVCLYAVPDLRGRS